MSETWLGVQGAGGAFLAQLEGMAGMVRVQQGVADTRKVG